MRFASINGRAHLVSPDGTMALDIDRASGGALPASPMDCFSVWRALRSWAAGRGDFDVPVTRDQLDAPSPSPRQMFGIGLNYRSHAIESKMEIPTAPLTFPKFSSSVNAPFGKVAITGTAVDFEAELVVVIADGGRDIPANDAWRHVAGVCAGQDISDRALQFAGKPPQFGLGKSRAGYSPFGPWLTSPDEISNPDRLTISCAINGEEMQRASTDDLIFSVPAIIDYLSSVVELYPGDVIFTGTPGGIGAMRQPPRFLQPGDTLTTSLHGLGDLHHSCVSAE